MLKWLVTKSPSPSDQVFTDDPFATLSHSGAAKDEIIYSVSRINPLFEEDGSTPKKSEVEETNLQAKQLKRQRISYSPPESPATDRESVKSSGYGSKEADSVSYQSDTPDDAEAENDEEVIYPPNFNSPGSVSQLRKSFETLSDNAVKIPKFEITQQNSDYVKSVEVENIPIDSSSLDDQNELNNTFRRGKDQPWPRVSHLAEALKRQTERISTKRANESNKKEPGNKGQILRFNPLVSVVAQDRRYVTAISVSPNSKAQQQQANISRNSASRNNNSQQKPVHFDIEATSVPSYFNTQGNSHSNEYPLLSLQPDSLVTEDTLKMMHYPDYRMKSRNNSTGSYIGDEYPPPAIPAFGKSIYSGFYSSGHSESSGNSNYARSNASSSHSAKKKGIFVVKDLWEKTGLITNGRKFLVDINDLLEKNEAKLNEQQMNYTDEKVFSVSHYIDGNNRVYKNQLVNSRPPSQRYSRSSEEFVYSPSNSDSSSNYERVLDYKHGADNATFIDDLGRTYGQFKMKPNFHQNLTSFQRRVTDSMQDEPSHRKSWVDLEKNTDDRLIEYSNTHKSPQSSNKSSNKSSRKSKSNAPHAGKAIREFGLTYNKDEGKYGSRSIPSNNVHNKDNSQTQNLWRYFENKRYPFWESHWKSSLKNASLSSFFSPHPNCGPIYEQGSDICHDFTLDTFKIHRLSNIRAKKKYRRRCLMIFLLFIALFCFIGALVGISWYITNGQRLFGAM